MRWGRGGEGGGYFNCCTEGREREREVVWLEEEGSCPSVFVISQRPGGRDNQPKLQTSVSDLNKHEPNLPSSASVNIDSLT